jgi:hypothetical protein
MEQTLFYIVGSALVAAAVALSAVGLRYERFPLSRGSLTAVLAGLALLVVATSAAAVIAARDEQKHRRAEWAHEAEKAGHEAGAESAEAEETGTEGPPGATEHDQEAAEAE